MAEQEVAAHKKGAQRTGATVVFLDETGFSQRPSVRSSWAPKGQTPVLREPFNWKRLSAIGAVAWRPGQGPTRLFLSWRPGSVDTEKVVAFLRSLRRHIRGKVVLLWDGLGAHRSRQVKQYVVNNQHWLRAERLPAYAPELNPVEGLWAVLSNRHLANYLPDSLDQLGEQLRRSIRRIRRNDTIGIHFIQHAGLLSQRQCLQLCEAQ